MMECIRVPPGYYLPIRRSYVLSTKTFHHLLVAQCLSPFIRLHLRTSILTNTVFMYVYTNPYSIVYAILGYMTVPHPNKSQERKDHSATYISVSTVRIFWELSAAPGRLRVQMSYPHGRSLRVFLAQNILAYNTRHTISRSKSRIGASRTRHRT